MLIRTFAFRQLSSVVAVSALIVPQAVYAQVQTYALDIPSQDLDSGLKALAAATGQQVVFRGQTVKGKRSNALKGNYTADAAFAAIISGTGLAASRSARNVVVIAPPKVAAADDDTGEQDIVVTGSHIRDANPTSPVHVVTRKDIENSGYSTIGDVVRSLPQNYAGGQNPGVTGFSNSTTNLNFSNASTANLRGLGSDATLTLVNGHRMVSDGNFQSSDISGIPLAAIARVEVLTDGASATYGADAVAGVMNIILDRRYDGLDTSARLGVATQGGGFEQTYSVLAGKSGDRSYAMLNFEYSDQDAVKASERDFTSGAYPDTSLLQAQQRYSVFFSGGYNISPDVSIFLDGLYSDRSAYKIGHLEERS